MPGLSGPPSWARGRLPLRARETISPLERSVPLSPWPALHVPPFRKDPGLHWLSACAHVCACVWSLPSRRHPLPGMGGPFLPACPPPCSVFLGLGPHTIIPPVGGLLNFLLYVPQWGNRAFPTSPGRVLHPSIHALTPWLFFSPPQRVGRGRAPRRGAAVGFFLVIGHLLPASPGVF